MANVRGTASSSPVTALPQLRLYRLLTGAALVVAPALYLLDNLIHPKEYERDHELQQLASIGDNYTRWQLAHVIGFLAIIVFAAAVLGLAFLVRRRQPMLGLVAGALALAGLLGLAAVITIDGFSWGIAGETSRETVPGPSGAAAVLDDLQDSRWAYIYYLVPLGFIVGMIGLAVGAVQQGAVPRWAGALLGLGVLMVGTETVFVSNAYFIAGAAVFLVGAIATALPIFRMSDAQFAQGGA
jgi:hypothetical protein